MLCAITNSNEELYKIVKLFNFYYYISLFVSFFNIPVSLDYFFQFEEETFSFPVSEGNTLNDR